MYLVHSGTMGFFKDYYQRLIDRLDENIITFDILRILQTFSEISAAFPDIFDKLEFLILKRFE